MTDDAHRECRITRARRGARGRIRRLTRSTRIRNRRRTIALLPIFYARKCKSTRTTITNTRRGSVGTRGGTCPIQGARACIRETSQWRPSRCSGCRCRGGRCCRWGRGGGLVDFNSPSATAELRRVTGASHGTIRFSYRSARLRN